MHDISRRRIATVARHLLTEDAVSSQSGSTPHVHCLPALQPQNTAAEQSSYAKVHGPVSRKAAKWTQIPAVQRHDLSEVIYEKVEDEGIAKVVFDLTFIGEVVQLYDKPANLLPCFSRCTVSC